MFHVSSLVALVVGSPIVNFGSSATNCPSVFNNTLSSPILIDGGDVVSADNPGGLDDIRICVCKAVTPQSGRCGSSLAVDIMLVSVGTAATVGTVGCGFDSDLAK